MLYQVQEGLQPLESNTEEEESEMMICHGPYERVNVEGLELNVCGECKKHEEVSKLDHFNCMRPPQFCGSVTCTPKVSR